MEDEKKPLIERLERLAGWLLQKAQDAMNTGIEISAVMAVSAGDDLHLVLVPEVPDTAEARAERWKEILSRFPAADGFVLMTDAWMRDPEDLEKKGEGLITFCETRAGEAVAIGQRYAREDGKIIWGERQRGEAMAYNNVWPDRVVASGVH